jgi:hypothetical protein
MKIILFITITFLLSIFCACGKADKSVASSELLQVFQHCNLLPSESIESYKDLEEIEEADLKLYAPIIEQTFFLKSAAPTSDSEGLIPRYWLRVEDYETVEKAKQRAFEYKAVGAYERVEKAYATLGKSSFILSKESVRIWAIARGKRVYALTTNVSLFTIIETPKKLRKAIELLPET